LQCLFCFLAIGHIDSNSNVTNKGTILIKPRHSHVENPSILPVVPAEPILHPEFLSPIKGLRVGVETLLQMLRVDTFCPAGSKLGVHALPGEIQPRLIDVGAEFISAGLPDQHRSTICEPAKTRFALTPNSFCIRRGDLWRDRSLLWNSSGIELHRNTGILHQVPPWKAII